MKIDNKNSLIRMTVEDLETLQSALEIAIEKSYKIDQKKEFKVLKNQFRHIKEAATPQSMIYMPQTFYRLFITR